MCEPLKFFEQLLAPAPLNLPTDTESEQRLRKWQEEDRRTHKRLLPMKRARADEDFQETLDAPDALWSLGTTVDTMRRPGVRRPEDDLDWTTQPQQAGDPRGRASSWPTPDLNIHQTYPQQPEDEWMPGNVVIDGQPLSLEGLSPAEILRRVLEGR